MESINIQIKYVTSFIILTPKSDVCRPQGAFGKAAQSEEVRKKRPGSVRNRLEPHHPENRRVRSDDTEE